MRIISGTAKGKRLSSFQGESIRPTPDRVREAVFSILVSRLGTLHGKSVLDLFAGTGAMAIEALSRGAERAVLVDQDPQANRLIAANLQSCGVAQKGSLVRGDVLRTLPRLAGASYDLIFLDPPYRKGLLEETLQTIGSHALLAAGGIVCAESDRREEPPEEVGGLTLDQRRHYGSTAIHIYVRPEA